jgi:hypothetical protein
VEGGTVWTWSPAYPRSGPPFASALDRVRGTQNRFWAVNMGEPEAFDPMRETEYLVEGDLLQAERDGTLEHLASTYDPQADRLYPGTGRTGPRVLDFAPLLVLERHGLTQVVKELLDLCAQELGEPVEIEFAGTLPRRGKGKAFLGFLQVRPLVVCQAQIEIGEEELDDPRVLIASGQVMGNGRIDHLRDILYLRPDRFDPARSREIAGEVALLNDTLREEGAEAVLIGFGRWGSSDPWLGVPVNWSQIGQARVIVESTLPRMQVDMSQGSHFFHNLTSFQVPYFSVPQGGKGRIDWTWLERQPAQGETEHLRWLRLEKPLVVRVDGRQGRGYVRRGDQD